MNVRHFLIGVALPLLLVIASGCDRQQKVSADTPKTLTLILGEENTEGFDPTLGWGSYGNPLFQSTLLKRDADLKIVSDLATKWELGDGQLAWTVKIRPEVVFSDGSPLTARDVAYTFNTAAKAGGVVDLSNLQLAEAIDDSTVILRLKHPDITFIQHLITLGIVPEKLHGPGYGRKPIGSGPYKLVRWDEGHQSPDRHPGQRGARKGNRDKAQTKQALLHALCGPGQLQGL